MIIFRSDPGAMNPLHGPALVNIKNKYIRMAVKYDLPRNKKKSFKTSQFFQFIYESFSNQMEY